MKGSNLLLALFAIFVMLLAACGGGGWGGSNCPGSG
jgi:hypothetical protein